MVERTAKDLFPRLKQKRSKNANSWGGQPGVDRVRSSRETGLNTLLLEAGEKKEENNKIGLLQRTKAMAQNDSVSLIFPKRKTMRRIEHHFAADPPSLSHLNIESVHVRGKVASAVLVGWMPASLPSSASCCNRPSVMPCSHSIMPTTTNRDHASKAPHLRAIKMCL